MKNNDVVFADPWSAIDRGGGRVRGARVAEILMVEDDSADANLMRRALERGRLTLNLRWVEDGEAAMAYLRGEGQYADARRPDLVLLDLNMPKKDGYAVLSEVRADPKLATLPIVILTTSQSDTDIARSYALHANAYVVKPVGLDGFLSVLTSIDGFWFTVVTVPPEPRGQGDR